MRSWWSRWRRVVAWSVVTVCALALLGIVTGWMLFQRIPTWYAPVHVAAADLQRVRDSLTCPYNEFSAGMMEGRPFEFRITQQELNEWLAARGQIWPAAQEWVPPTMEGPLILFEPDRIVVAGTVSLGEVRTVLSASVSLHTEGDSLVVRLDSLHGGALPVPRSLVREQLRQLDARQRGTGRDRTRLPSAETLFGGTRVPAVFSWNNPHRRFRIRAVRVKNGEILLDIEPLPRDRHAHD